MTARQIVLSYVASHPHLAPQINRAIDAGLTWAEIAAILTIAAA